MNFTHPKFKNLHINFVKEGVEVVVTLNVEQKMVPHLPFPNQRVWKNDKFFVYVLKSIVTEVNYTSINGCYNWLLNRAMIDCREAKRKAIEIEIKHLKNEKVNIHPTLFNDIK